MVQENTISFEDRISKVNCDQVAVAIVVDCY